jgi:multicomponent Na+:H+ antiporter subunit D
METLFFPLIIAIPVAAAPIIYLTGRFGWRLGNPWLEKLSGWLCVEAFVVSAIFLALAIRQYSLSGPQTFMVEAIALRFDGLSMLTAIVAMGLGGLVALYSLAYMEGEAGAEKYYAMLAVMVGVMVGLGCAGDLFNLWVWFEAMAVSSYLLVVFYRSQPASLEAGVKYVIQSATGSVLVLIAIALVLMQTGTVTLSEIAVGVDAEPILLAAGALFVVGFGVKAALVPLHTWLPDAHSQAPSGISAMLSGVVIEMGLIAMLRALGPLTGINGHGYPAATWGWVLIVAGAVNMIAGNLMALKQTQVKRLLAFSSVSQVGYILFGAGVALYGGQLVGIQGSMFHLLNHSLMKGLAFLAIGALMYAVSQASLTTTNDESIHLPIPTTNHHRPMTIAEMGGAAQRFPLVALALSLAVLSLAGLPPLAGFMSKWQVFVAGFATHNVVIILLVIFAALNSVLSLGYYAPLVNTIYKKKMTSSMKTAAAIPWTISLPLALMSLGIVVLGLWPGLAQWPTSAAGKAILSSFGW